MYRCPKEPPLEELLNDPIARLLMASDRVELADLRTLLNVVAMSGKAHAAAFRKDGAAAADSSDVRVRRYG
jgi:hypothetical protein